MTVFPSMTGKESQQGGRILNDGKIPYLQRQVKKKGFFENLGSVGSKSGIWPGKLLEFSGVASGGLIKHSIPISKSLLRASQIKEMGQTFANWTEARYKSTMKSSKPTENVNQFRESHSKVFIWDFRESISKNQVNIKHSKHGSITPWLPRSYSPPNPKKKRGPFRYF